MGFPAVSASARCCDDGNRKTGKKAPAEPEPAIDAGVGGPSHARHPAAPSDGTLEHLAANEV
jgi:hypothetical protein